MVNNFIDVSDNTALLAVLTLLGAAIGIIVSIENPAAGFMIVGSTITVAIIGVTINVKKLFDGRLPNYGAFIRDRGDTFIYAVYVVAAFIPLLVPQLILAAALITLAAGVFKAYDAATKPGGWTEDEVLDTALTFLVFAVFFLVYSLQGLLIIPVILTTGLFVWSITPETTKDDVREVLDL